MLFENGQQLLRNNFITGHVFEQFGAQMLAAILIDFAILNCNFFWSNNFLQKFQNAHVIALFRQTEGI